MAKFTEHPYLLNIFVLDEFVVKLLVVELLQTKTRHVACIFFVLAVIKAVNVLYCTSKCIYMYI